MEQLAKAYKNKNNINNAYKIQQEKLDQLINECMIETSNQSYSDTVHDLALEHSLA